MEDPEKFCDKMNEWAALMSNSSGRISSSSEFSHAWRIIKLAIDKSCLLNRTIYNNEKPSQTQCPVHKGKWFGIALGWPDQKWGDGSLVKEDPKLREEYNQGCRCYLHSCGCTTGWNIDEFCGCKKE